MIYFVIALCVGLDAATDGLRAALHRPWTVGMGILADLVALACASQLGLSRWGEGWQANLLLVVLLGIVGVGRMLQEQWWHDPRYHKGRRFDAWHIAKQARFLVPLVAIVALSGLSRSEVGILAVCSWVWWRMCLMAARGTWDFRRPWR